VFYILVKMIIFITSCQQVEV